MLLCSTQAARATQHTRAAFQRDAYEDGEGVAPALRVLCGACTITTEDGLGCCPDGVAAGCSMLDGEPGSDSCGGPNVVLHVMRL
jgi:hypothetical protein